MTCTEAYATHGSTRKAAKALGLAESTYRRRLEKETGQARSGVEQSTDEKTGQSVLTLRSSTVRTLEGALAVGNVDTREWEVERWVLNKWDSVAKLASNEGGLKETLAATELWQVKVWLRRKSNEQRGVESLLDDIRKASIPVRTLSRHKPKKGQRRSLEICIVDPHLGMNCFPPASDKAWTLDQCEELYLWAVDELLRLGQQYGPFESIQWPFGNDYLHADGISHRTTAGTEQPEMEPWHEVYRRGYLLAIEAANRMKEHAPLTVRQIPGNHDRQSSYTMGHILWAYFNRDASVTVDHDASPYKFWHYGCNLIGWEHGHSIKPLRLSSLMANECPDEWAATKGGYREWHLGDQHRKGSSSLIVMEEQGVSVEYLAGMTPPNEWHRVKGFNWQKRGAVAFVYDYDLGPVARLQVNLNSWTGKPMGK